MSFIASIAATLGELAVSGLVAGGIGTAAGAGATSGLLGAGATAGLGTVLGGVGAGALTGSALSAGTAALTGGDVGDAAGMGALTGGLTGGLTSGIGLLGSAPASALGAAPGEMFGAGAASAAGTPGSVIGSEGLTNTMSNSLGSGSSLMSKVPTGLESQMGSAIPSSFEGLNAGETGIASNTGIGSQVGNAIPSSFSELTSPVSTSTSNILASNAGMTPVEGVPTGLRNAANWVNRNQTLAQGIGTLGGNMVLGPMMQNNNMPKVSQPKSQFSWSGGQANYDPNNFVTASPNPDDYMYHPAYAEGGLASLNAFASGGGVGIGRTLNDIAIPGTVDFLDSMAINSPVGAIMGWDNPEDVPFIGDAYRKKQDQNSQQPQQPAQNYASGGIASLGSYSDGGQLLKGPGDGVSDDIPASINGGQPARLADGEFVIPARIVSELGNGSTEAGAKRLYDMVHRVNAERAKSAKKGAFAKDTRAYKHLPI
jgi:hypothetical protein